MVYRPRKDELGCWYHKAASPFNLNQQTTPDSILFSELRIIRNINVSNGSSTRFENSDNMSNALKQKQNVSQVDESHKHEE